MLNALSCYVDGSSSQPMASFQAPSPSSAPSALPPASERSAASVSRSVQSQAALFREGIDPKGCFGDWAKLGAGASGVVYRAKPLNGGCGGRSHVALKVRKKRGWAWGLGGGQLRAGKCVRADGRTHEK